MIHYYRVNTDGEIMGAIGCDSRFPSDCDLTDPGCMHPVSIQIRRYSETLPGFDRIVAFNCACSHAETDFCQCAYMKRCDYYADGSTLVEKPTLTILVDGNPRPEMISLSPIVATTGTVMKLKLQAAAPDGHQVEIHNPGSVSIIAETTTLTFNGGETEELSLVVPAHGATGSVLGLSKYVRQFKVQLKGWNA